MNNRGKFTALDDLDLAGHRLRDWQWLDDIPHRGANDGQVLAIVGGEVQWATATSSGIVSTEWDDITDKPSVFPPEDHEHDWSDITGEPTYAKDFNANFLIDGGGTYVVDGAKGWFRIPTDCTLKKVSVFADKTDTCTFSVDTGSYADHPSSYADATGGLNLVLSAASKYEKTSLATWTTSYDKGDLIKVTVDTTNTTQTQLLLVFDFERR